MPSSMHLSTCLCMPRSQQMSSHSVLSWASHLPHSRRSCSPSPDLFASDSLQTHLYTLKTTLTEPVSGRSGSSDAVFFRQMRLISTSTYSKAVWTSALKVLGALEPLTKLSQ